MTKDRKTRSSAPAKAPRKADAPRGYEPAPLPAGEAARLAALRRLEILDTPPEPAFDRIARLAAHHFRAPIALIVFVDEKRQWFKARIGLDMIETPRDLSFCAHAILDGGVFVVLDATRDPRFAGNPYVTGAPGIRFYAGAPLTTRGGHRLGTLCVIDTEPRQEFSARDSAALADFAALAVDELALRAVNDQLERARREAEGRAALLDAAVAHARDAVLIIESDLRTNGPRIVYVNPAFAEMTGYAPEELVEGTPRILQGPLTDRATLDRLRGALKRCEPVRVELTNYAKDGRLFEIELDVAPVFAGDGETCTHFVAVQRDITDRKRDEEAARRRSKLEGLGTLAGGIAHDFNNLLLGLSGVLERALDELPANRRLARSLRLALDATQRGRDLVRQITAFARRDPLELAPALLDETVARAVDLLGAALPPGIAVRRRIEPVGEALVDAAQLHRVVLNLGFNAADAIGDAAGTISIGLERVEIDAAFAVTLGLPRAGAHACLTVHDTGRGMKPEVRERAFDPFFTTKPVGEGMGLGLSVVHGIVTEHGGAVSVETEPGRGSCFTVYLPLAGGTPSPSPLREEGGDPRNARGG